MPCAMSNRTPRSRAARTSRRTRPSSPRAEFGLGAEAMGEDVARAQHRHDVGIAWRGWADMGHQRQPDGLGGFQRQFQRPETEIAGHDAADPHLHADDAVAVGFDLGDAAVDRQHVAQRRLADRDALVEAEDAGKRDVEKREDAVGRMGHHIVAEAVVVAGAGAAGIDQRRRAGAPRDEARIDAERRRLVIDVGVDVDEARRDDQPARRSRPAPRRLPATGRPPRSALP